MGRITEHLENPIKAFFLLSKKTKNKNAPVSGGPQFCRVPFRDLELRTATHVPLVSVNARMPSASCLARVVRASPASEQASPQLICRHGRGPGLPRQPAVLEQRPASCVQAGRTLRPVGGSQPSRGPGVSGRLGGGLVMLAGATAGPSPLIGWLGLAEGTQGWEV